jgi:hypothetical protein
VRLFVIKFLGRDTRLPARLFAEKVTPVAGSRGSRSIGLHGSRRWRVEELARKFTLEPVSTAVDTATIVALANHSPSFRTPLPRV